MGSWETHEKWQEPQRFRLLEKYVQPLVARGPLEGPFTKLLPALIGHGHDIRGCLPEPMTYDIRAIGLRVLDELDRLWLDRFGNVRLYIGEKIYGDFPAGMLLDGPVDLTIEEAILGEKGHHLVGTGRRIGLRVPSKQAFCVAVVLPEGTWEERQAERDAPAVVQVILHGVLTSEVS